MFQAYTERAEHVLQCAKKISRQLGHSYVGTEHLLIGLLREKSCVPGQLLARKGVEEEKVLSLIAELIAPEQGNAVAERPGYTPRARFILEQAGMEAERFGETRISTEHIFLAMLKDVECVASRLLNTLSVSAREFGIYGCKRQGVSGGKCSSGKSAGTDGRKHS